MHWLTALPMYNVTPALADDWRALLADVRIALAGWLDARGDTLDIVDPGPDLTAFWLRDDVLLSQTCGYPLVNALNGRVRVIAAAGFDVPGCADGCYHSVLVTGPHVRAETLAECRGLRAVYNGDDSNSGMNLLRHAVAPLARDGRFFSTVTKSGAHLASLRALAVDKNADIAAIDCVTFAFARAFLPELSDGVREIGVTASTPALPFIASMRVPASDLDTLARAFDTALARDPDRARRLRLTRFVRRTPADYAPIARLERDAAALGYPRLA